MSKFVIYHNHCWDGLASAWVAKQALPDATLYPGTHQDPPPDVTGQDVVIIDFSYKRAILSEMITKANSLLVIDHHATAQEDLSGLDNCIFDLNKSGSGLAWDHFFPDKPRPWIINYIEDQDLWRFALPASKEINAGISSYPRTLDTFDSLGSIPWDGELPWGFIEQLVTTGAAIIKYRDQLVQRIINHSKIIEFEGYKIPIVNTAILHSEVGAKFSEKYPFSLTWFYENGFYIYSLRSSSMDISPIALKYGGGGHPKSSGFRLKYLIT